MNIKLIFLPILLLAPLWAQADEFDWDAEGLKVTRIEMPTDNQSILIELGSLCYASVCEVAATYTLGEGKQELFERTITNAPATASLDGDRLKVSLIHYPQGSDKGIQTNLWFRWDDGQLVQTRSEPVNIE